MKQPSHRGYAELVKAHRDRPRDADAAAELAYAHLCREANAEALDLAREALKLRPKHPLATYVAGAAAADRRHGGRGRGDAGSLSGPPRAGVAGVAICWPT